MPSGKQRIRDRVLRRRGLEPVSRKHLTPTMIEPPLPDPTGRKSLAMRLVEVRYGRPLEELLDGMKLADAARMIGVSESAICRLRKRLGIGPWSR